MKILVLAGSGEARALARRMAAAQMDAVASLAGVTRTPEPLALPTRIGGFGSAEGFATYLREGGFGAVIDATHPFANAISLRSARVVAEMGLPYVQLLRPGWTPGPGDDWTFVKDAAAVAGVIPPGQRVFLATGSLGVAAFGALDAAQIWCRRIDAAPEGFPLANGEWLVGRPPFSVADEVALFSKLRVDWLVVKNAGGVPSRTKLDAARQLQIPVVMLKRPVPPVCDKVENVDEAMAWLRNLR